MSKRQNTDLIGYIHTVSPSKKNKSFHFQIQTGAEKPRKAICFDGTKYNVLKEKRMSGEPVKITSAILQSNVQSNYAEIVVNKSSSITEVEPIQVEFPRIETEFSYVSLDDESLKVGDRVNIKAAVDLSHATCTEVLMGTRRKTVMNNATLYNKTNSLHLTLWDDWIDHLKELTKKNSTFKIHSLIVKEYNGEISLSTCSDTEFHVLHGEDFSIPEANSFGSLQKIVTVDEFDYAQDVLYEYVCHHCKKGFKAIQGPDIVKCYHCTTTQRVSTVEKRVLLKVKAKVLGESYFLLNAKDLVPYISPVDPCSFQTDQDVLISQVMQLKSLKVIVEDGLLSILPPVELKDDDDGSDSDL